MCEVIGDPPGIEASTSPRCRTNRAPQNKTENVDAHNTNTNMPDCFRSNTNRETDKRAS